MPHHVLNLAQTAAHLHLSEADVELLVRRREIPHERAGSRLVFRKQEIDAWASQRILGLRQDRLAAFHRTSTVKHHDISPHTAIVSELTRPDFIEPAMVAKTRASLLREMVRLAEATGLVTAPEDLHASLSEREELCPTALAGGFALLHPRHHDPYLFDDSFVMLARAAHPVPFGGPDGKLTDLFFLVCCQDDRIHLHVLARLCMICSRPGILADLRQAADREAIYALLSGAEAAILETLR